MDDRLTISRTTVVQMRAALAQQLQSAIGSFRGDIASLVADLVDHLSLLSPQFDGVFTGDGRLSESINDVLDRIYADFLVRYTDAFALEDARRRLAEFFIRAIYAQLAVLAEQEARLRASSSAVAGRYLYTDSIYESFTGGRNYSAAPSCLAVNRQAGTLRLPCIESSYDGADRTNVTIVPLSAYLTRLERGSSDGVYRNNPLEPFYLSAYSTALPDNETVCAGLFAGTSGALFDIVIALPVISPVSRVSFAAFGNGTVRFVGAYGSQVPDPDWKHGELDELTVTSAVDDNLGLDIAFARTMLRELHLVVEVREFDLVRGPLALERAVSTGATLETLADVLDELPPLGIHTTDVRRSFGELASFFSRRMQQTTEHIAENCRVYCCGLYALHLSDAAHAPYGEYETIPLHVDGCVLELGATVTESLIASGESASVCTVLSAVVEGHDLPLSLGTVTQHDGAVLRTTMIPSGSIEIVDVEHPLLLQSHFLVDTDALDAMVLYYNGTGFPLPSGTIVSRRDWHHEFALPSGEARELGLYDGAVVTMDYPLPDTDPYGNPYQPASLVLFDHINNPTFRHQLLVAGDPCLYVPFSGEYIQYAGDEYSPVTRSGESFFALSGKGETASGEDILEIGGRLYARSSYVVGPYRQFFYGVIDEAIATYTETTLGGVPVHAFATAYPYVRGSLNVQADGPVSILGYDDDTTGAIVPLAGKCAFYTSTDYTSVTVSYIPIEPTCASALVATNIAQPNVRESFQRLTDRALTLSRYPYVEQAIVSSERFDLYDGVFSLRERYSIVYEPFVVYVGGGTKAINRSRYRADQEEVRTLPGTYTYTVENGNRIVFENDPPLPVIVQYYAGADSIRARVRMYRSDYTRTDLSPELRDYTLFINARKLIL